MTTGDDARLVALMQRLGHAFADPTLLVQALTHTSVDPQDRRQAPFGYQRLEFLGDRVLNLIVAEALFERYPDEPEGALAHRYIALVRQDALAQVAREIGLGAHLRLAASDEQLGARDNPAILADACEAVIGALYRDGGLATASAFVRNAWAPLFDRDPQPIKNPKSMLQEWAEGRGLQLPEYRLVTRTGPAHRPAFTVRVSLAGHGEAEAEGPAKRVAELAAAAALLDRLGVGDGR